MDLDDDELKATRKLHETNRKIMSEEILEQFAKIFTNSLKMLEEEIDENHENLHTLKQVENLVDRWNNLYYTIFGSDENE